MTKIKCDGCGRIQSQKHMALFKDGYYCYFCRKKKSSSLIPPQDKDIIKVLAKVRTIKKIGNSGGHVYVPGRFIGLKVRLVPVDDEGRNIEYEL